jgi:hypothetical protein
VNREIAEVKNYSPLPLSGGAMPFSLSQTGSGTSGLTCMHCSACSFPCGHVKAPVVPPRRSASGRARTPDTRAVQHSSSLQRDHTHRAYTDRACQRTRTRSEKKTSPSNPCVLRLIAQLTSRVISAQSRA